MAVSEPFGLAQPDPVDYARVVQTVADHRVFRVQNRFEEPRIGIETGTVQNRVLCAIIARNPVFQLFMQRLCPADKPHRTHPEPEIIHRVFGRLNYRRVVRKPQIVIRTEIQSGAGWRLDEHLLGGQDLTFGFVGARRMHQGKFGLELR
jgi:hypothetical protein